MSLEAIHYQNLTEKLLEAVPEVVPAYNREMQWWGKDRPGQHIVFHTILTPHIAALLGKHGSESELRRVFGFLETLASHSDEEVQNVIAVTMCEDICSDEVMLQKAQPFLGEKTRQFCKSLMGEHLP